MATAPTQIEEVLSTCLDPTKSRVDKEKPWWEPRSGTLRGRSREKLATWLGKASYAKDLDFLLCEQTNLLSLTSLGVDH